MTEDSHVNDVPFHVIFLYISFGYQSLFQFIICHTDATNVKVDHLLYSLSIHILHSIPVLEHPTDECYRRNSGDGVICLTYLYSCKGDVYDRSINESAGYCDTISDVNHVVTGQTDTCYESVYRILEHQHEDG